jgi:hypothetical protein
MKYIKKFNEALSQKQLDDILDKIHKTGMSSLSEIERKELENINNPTYNFREEIINDIKLIVEKYGQYITMSDLQASTSPVYTSIDQQIHLIERLMTNQVELVAYGGYKYDTELDEYYIPYVKLNNLVLLEIKELLDNAIENEFLDEDV